MRLNFLLFILVLGMSYLTCRTFKKTEPVAGTVQPDQPSLDLPVKAARVSGFGEDTASIQQRVTEMKRIVVPVDEIPPPTASKKAFMSTGWWHCNMAISPTDTTIKKHYLDKWMKFREDQTFDILVKGKVTSTGRWNWNSANNVIYLSCDDPYLNNTWQVQDKGFVMIWKGNTDLNLTGIQIRVVGTKTPPN